jgi:ribose-phosphate pyrophosphokinase
MAQVQANAITDDEQGIGLLFYAFPGFSYLMPVTHPGAKEGKFVVKRYPNREIYVELQNDVAARECVVIGTIAPPDENLISWLQLTYTLKKEGAARVTAVLPYLAYAREDKDGPGQGVGTALVGQLLEAAGVDEAFAIDVHSSAVHGLFPMPLHSLLPSELWAREIVELRQSDVAIVAPDLGAIERCQAVAKAAHIAQKVTYIEKHHVDGIVHSSLVGPVTPNMVIVDDLLDTGTTLISCAERLRQAGAEHIVAAISHGLFTGDKWENVWAAGIEKIYCLDTVPAAKTINHPKVTIIPSAGILGTILSSLKTR